MPGRYFLRMSFEKHDEDNEDLEDLSPSESESNKKWKVAFGVPRTSKGTWEWIPTFFVLLAGTCCFQAGSQLFVPHVKLVRSCLILLEVTRDYCWMLLCPAQSVRDRAAQTLAGVIGYFKWVVATGLSATTFQKHVTKPHLASLSADLC